MGIFLEAEHPSYDRLKAEGAAVFPSSCQTHRAINVLILNLMPTVQETELQLLRQLARAKAFYKVSWLYQSARPIRRVPQDHIEKFYLDFSTAQNLAFEALIITGAPVEKFEFEAVTYWNELTQVMQWADDNRIPTLHICWAAFAGVYRRYGITKKLLPSKLSGIFEYAVDPSHHKLLKDLGPSWNIPHSRFAYWEKEAFEPHKALKILLEQDVSGIHAALDEKRGHLYLTGHGEYDSDTLHLEYQRDVEKEPLTAAPLSYYDNENQIPKAHWQSNMTQLIDNWTEMYLKSQKKKVIGIGLLGFGTVGQGLVEVLSESRQKVLDQYGLDLQIRKILVSNLDKHLSQGKLATEVLTTEAAEVTQNPQVDIVIEALSGAHPAAELLKEALNHFKNVVTANKAALAESMGQLEAIALEKGLKVRYEAAIGGGIPIVALMKESLAANSIEEIEGILNGTTNFMLTRLAKADITYEEALYEAKALGYAEADPTFDVEGYDSAYKLLLLARLAFGKAVTFDDIECEGITALTERDFLKARAEGGRIKLIASAKKTVHGIALSVKPKVLDIGNPLATTDGVDNAIRIKDRQIGKLFISGPGAGARPTGSALLADVLTIATSL